LNITDGAAEALSKLKEWKKASSEGEQLDAHSITATNRVMTIAMASPPRIARVTEANRFVARKAANAPPRSPGGKE
jgi:hypothetical protein